MRERVVITGMGLVCPMGHDVETVWEGILSGKHGFGQTTIFDASTFPSKFGAEVKGFDLAGRIRYPELHSHANRGAMFVIGAAAEACRQAGIEIETDAPTDGIDRRRMGIYLGAGEGSVDNENFFGALVRAWDNAAHAMDWGAWAEVAFSKMTAMRELEQEPNMPAGHIAVLTGARGITLSCLTACAASTQAVGEAAMLIRHGRADIMIAGGAHSMIHPLGVTGFNRLTALSTRNDSPETASRPFSASRDGFVLGEGGAIVILESLSSAKRRGAKILAELIGFGSSSDAFRVTDMHEEARGAVQAMRAAMKDAGVTCRDIDYISTHGTSTAENDHIETLAIKTVFGEHAKNVPASSPKSMFGHLIGATGCAELITCVLAIRDGVLPPTMNLHDPDPELDLDYVPNAPRKADVKTVMSESFGFGGQNNVLIIRRFSE
ncbi:MAG TPA: beta-ketoacyl-[acyl-carrier-protein] synthase family protein [Anaerohalosphaeraceae bacterium]|jgi:3-oxoacyl-[acyl-carrier-protein] synthase II|nr:beta-ketoacyl-[acyl-carrier-protein] synthase family protein [Anaerohalosphaeraceae bacterium]HRT49581.1 beta-ketoacyl-[acyl-carrier-protein] synthase family protein [Anaerohalosphaeraceae bacterium]HRT85484.1 beta-ketoacyl-[acyl-carrier-protein] synthase family protein [Anaerohalosphaeraceae bacterium]